MIINVDEKGMEAIQQLTDIALKFGGNKNLQGVNKILSSIKFIEDIKPELTVVEE